MTPQDLIDTIDGLLGKKDDRALRGTLARLTAEEIAQVINRLPHGKRKTFGVLPPEVQAEVAIRLDEAGKEYVIPRVSDVALARFLHFNEEDDAVDILQFVDEKRRPGILAHLKPEKKAKLEKLLTFDPETAGGLMDLNFITVQSGSALKDVADQVRAHTAATKHTPLVAVMDAHGKAQGFVPFKALMLAATTPGKTVSSIMHRLPTFPHHADQERIVRHAMRERGEVYGVVDDDGKFLGVIHLRDLLKVAQMEATEDVYKFAGVSPEEEMLGSAGAAVRMRYRWLIVNLVTAFLASSVVSFFEGTIQHIAILAAYMPIVAGMGGNAGTQALAVAVRGLASSDITPQQRVQLVVKEMCTGVMNGLMVGTIVGGLVYVTRGNPAIGLILAVSMMINFMVAGIAGALIPIILKSFRIDPAVASSVFVTAATDFFGFLTFLGLSTIFLL